MLLEFDRCPCPYNLYPYNLNTLRYRAFLLSWREPHVLVKSNTNPELIYSGLLCVRGKPPEAASVKQNSSQTQWCASAVLETCAVCSQWQGLAMGSQGCRASSPLRASVIKEHWLSYCWMFVFSVEFYCLTVSVSAVRQSSLLWYCLVLSPFLLNPFFPAPLPPLSGICVWLTGFH